MAYKVKVMEKLVVVRDDSGNGFEFPIIWLRDNCQCSECYNSETFARIIDWDNFDFDVKPETVDVRLSYLLLLQNFISKPTASGRRFENHLERWPQIIFRSRVACGKKFLERQYLKLLGKLLSAEEANLGSGRI